MGNYFLKNSNGKSRYSTIHQRGDSQQNSVEEEPEIDTFLEEKIVSKKCLKLRVTVSCKAIVNVQHATMKNEIVRRSYQREWKLIYLNLHITTRSRICRLSLTYLINSKEAKWKVCKIWLKLGLHKDMETFQTLQTQIDHNAIRYHIAIRYHNAIRCIFSLSFAWFWAICNALLAFF